MEDTSKYLIHASISADGIVERSDVVGAVFGQTEGLLGEDLDLRDLQQTSRVGRIDVTVESERGQSFGSLTIASSLDRVETAILAASLETIERIGPCAAAVRVTGIEDVRGAKRRAVVERAKELLATAFEEDIMRSKEIMEEVRESVRVERITEYEGLPAGPRVAGGSAIIVVEGRADVLTLLRYGIKNAIAVEGTSVPEAVSDLTRDRTTTVFLDGDRGGDLILRELAQVGDVDYVAIAPEGRAVEDLARHEVVAALQDKVPFEVAMARIEGGGEAAADGRGPIVPGVRRDADEVPTGPRAPRIDAPTDHEDESGDGGGSADGGGVDGGTPTPGASTPDQGTQGGPAPAAEVADADRRDGAAQDGPEADAGDLAAGVIEPGADQGPTGTDGPGTTSVDGVGAAGRTDAPPADVATGTDEGRPAAEGGDRPADDGDAGDGAAGDGPQPSTLAGHVDAVIGSGGGTVRLLDDGFDPLATGPAEEAVEVLRDAEPVPAAVVLDGTCTQRLLDVAAERGVGEVVAAAAGEFTKQPTDVRLRLGTEFTGDGS